MPNVFKIKAFSIIRFSLFVIAASINAVVVFSLAVGVMNPNKPLVPRTIPDDTMKGVEMILFVVPSPTQDKYAVFLRLMGLFVMSE